MQQHPVPQNIIGFQFKLVGDMTLKQFGYLAGGIIVAIIASKLPYPAIFNYTLAGSFAFFGFALAFLPIEDRPLDVWLKNFIISIFSPTQFVYQKTGGALDFFNIDLSRNNQNSALIVEKSIKQDKYKDYLETLPSQQKNNIDLAINNYIKSLNFETTTNQTVLNSQTIKTTISQAPVSNIQSSQNSSSPLASTDEIKKVRPVFQEPVPTQNVQSSQQPKQTTKQQEITNQFQSIDLSKIDASSGVKYVKNSYIAPKQEIKREAPNFDYLIKKTDASLKDNHQLDTQIEAKKQEEIAQHLKNIQKQQTALNNQTQPTTEQSSSHVIDVSKVKKSYQTPQTPRTPNIISGTILGKDEQPVIGAIVEIKNQRGIAERTMRTNSIGQFQTATPLLPQEYTVHVEKTDMSFDIIRIILDNKIVEPMIIKAR